MPGGRKAENRDLAAVALASGKTVAEAATAAQVSERTVATWRADPTFRARVVELRGEMVAAAAGRLSSSMSQAADVLKGLLESETEAIRLRAADRLIELGLKVTELHELQKRVEEIEARLTAGDRS